ncbi:hypothetical protein DFJ73DRAFT_903335 [Zopfochytrium polystomum]|nr:hypothetical protein DFJ73DRAFT_903335 [Zopfochytrium polystomum]
MSRSLSSVLVLLSLFLALLLSLLSNPSLGVADARPTRSRSGSDSTIGDYDRNSFMGSPRSSSGSNPGSPRAGAVHHHPTPPQKVNEVRPAERVQHHPPRHHRRH